jgi:transposase InsO family protein
MKKPNKDAILLAKIKDIIKQDEENSTYGVQRMKEGLLFHHNAHVGTRRLRRIMAEHGYLQITKRKPNGLTKADKKANKSDDLIKRDFTATEPNSKVVTDITEVPAKDGKLYISAAFDCYDQTVLGLSMGTTMKTELVTVMVNQMVHRHGAPVILHSDRGSQYTSYAYREVLKKHGIRQSMNSAGGRCHDNAKCESMWARFKEEKMYHMDTKQYTANELKAIIFRYFMSYWNNRRICSAIGGIPPAYKRKLYLDNLMQQSAA